MEDVLFPVQRYYGDEDPGKTVDSEKNKLNLLAKIKERKKLKKVEEKTKHVDETISEASIPQDISFANNSPPINDPSVNHNTIHVKKKHKKEKKNRETNPSFEDESSVLPEEIDRLKIDDLEEENLKRSQELSDNTADNSAEGKEVFPIIGDYKFKKKHKVKRVLPDWLAKPSVVSVDLKNLDVSINDIPELHSLLVNTLQKNNITHFFPVQAQVIPWLLSWTKRSSLLWPCDVCVSAPTGSGKTLAYVLPVLQALMNCRTGGIQALVVLPVQDLAAQVASVFKTYSAGTGLKIHLSTGGVSLSQDRTHLLKERLGVGWESLVDILVITPGRLVEHLYSTPGFSLRQLQYIVIDEADRIVDNMQNNWLRHLDHHLSERGCPPLTLHNLKQLPRRPQKLLFSATLSTDPEKLNHLNLFQPRLFTSVVEATKEQGAEGEFIGKFTTPAELTERLVRCTLAVKPLVLYQLITKHSWSHVLVFTSSSRSVHQLCALLSLLATKHQRRLNVAEISAESSFKKREAVLSAFTAGKVDVLVSTDALARGMDITGVKYVVSYDMPKFVKAYIHRVGRTGRAGQPGTAVTMVQHTQIGMFKQMLQTAGKQDSVTELPVDEQELKDLEEPFREALKELKNVTKDEEMEKLQKTKSLKRVTSSKILGKRQKKREKNVIVKRIKKQ
ncbi:ATP-dependent RNA helicase DDX51 [Macrosteles quadrilineatus]|uniref:ATP-dependent RNA helicase DDX51 n=1 Tax=Macrosteles quadrilineatus TaxID=74068 RepID=UPI0023E1FE18|nr:ATP-dependent RNA helicase DDX51 [Macrosteles quadrilineatus]